MFWMTTFLFACQESEQKSQTPEPKVEQAPAAEKKEAAKAQDFGAPFAIEEVTQAKAVFDNPEGFVGKTVRVEGSVRDVCQKMGCWMVISEGDKSMRITASLTVRLGISVAISATTTGCSSCCPHSPSLSSSPERIYCWAGRMS